MGRGREDGDGDAISRIRGRRTRGRVGTRDWGRGEVRSGTRGRKIGDAGYIAEKREKVVIDRSKKMISSKEKAQTGIGYFPINPHRPANHGKYIHAHLRLGAKKHATYRDKNGVTHSASETKFTSSWYEVLSGISGK